MALVQESYYLIESRLIEAIEAPALDVKSNSAKKLSNQDK